MGVAMTNEERFIASCETVGEADVRGKLSADRYSERKKVWASAWLETMESGKSDATKAEEISSRLRSSASGRPHWIYLLSAVLIALLVAGAVVYLKLR
jgi:hypothetical protein